jgi:hypothetical protein
MPEDKTPDENQSADCTVRELTGQEPLNAEECFDSPELQRQFREAKGREQLRVKPLRK